MDTNHIVNSVRMLWNNSAPHHLRLKPYIAYNLKMTKKYVKSRLIGMLKELETRDLTTTQKGVLEFISQSLKVGRK